MEAAPEGYDVSAVEAWIDEHIPGLTPPLQWTRLEGGHSNLTYRIEDRKGRVAVIRRPPQGKLLPKAHDMGREWALISALGSTPVPVAEALGFCESPDVTGAWFYVMGFVDGKPLYSPGDTDRLVPEASRRRLGESFIDGLADLHSVDPDEVGLSGLGKKEDYVGRQLRTWYRSWTASSESAEYDDPRAHELKEFLEANVPEQGPARVVHGDYGLHNVLVGPDSTVIAIVDWEISTLGDPLADLGYVLAAWALPEDEDPPNDVTPTLVPGFPSREELASRYAARTGADLAELDYYLSFNHWKMSCIVHGVYARYKAGQKSTQGINMEGLRTRFIRSLDLAEEWAAKLR